MGTEINIKHIIRNWVIVPIIGGVIISIVFCPDCIANANWKGLTETAILSSLFWSFLANGNSYLSDLLDNKWSWIEYPVKRLVFSSLLMLVYTVICSIIIVYLYVELFKEYDFILVIKNEGWMSILLTPLVITLFIAIILHGRGFLLAWKEAAISVEKLKNENLSSKFESLKNQVNPHFLFNSLNALSSLVYTDQDKAAQFIQKLSEVYRYVLEHQYDELITIDTEMEFVKSYIYLNQIRFGDNLKVDYINLDKFDSSMAIPPLALQMLVENAIKHNEVSKEFPLSMKISFEDNMIKIWNNLNPIEIKKRESKGLGLNNIISRYNYLSNEKVIVNHNKDHFSVSIPLLKITKDEGTNNRG